MALNTMFLITLSVAAVALVSAASPPFQERKAIVVFKTEKVSGNVTFIQPNRGGPVTVSGTVTGLSEGQHGFHVHEKGDLTSGCASTGSHFNPQMKKHGGPADETRHAGDLGNIQVDNMGVASFSFQDSLISLVGAHNILGRAVVIHQDEDDLGLKGFTDSRTTGHAGSRVACGVIGLLEPTSPWDKSSGHRIPATTHVLLLTAVAAAVSALAANFF